MKNKTAEPTAEELALINKYARREMTAQEVYAFSVVLCDNEIDRDGERFSVASLEALAKLFVGKTGVFDHSMKGKDQTARVFSAAVEHDESRKTRAGEPYAALKARAYMPRTQKNGDLIEEIEAGIKKEVSVGCAVGRITCSVCGADMKKEGCEHVKGKTYGGRLCHGILEEPQDAYEWSFVAVPAQRGAGVVKTMKKNGEAVKTDNFILKLRKNEAICDEERDRLCEYIETLEKQAKAGEIYRAEIENEVLRLSACALPELDGSTADAIVKRLETDELQRLKKALDVQRAKKFNPAVQLAGEQKQAQTDHSAFRI